MADEFALAASRRLAEQYTPDQAAAALAANTEVGVPIEVAIRNPLDVLKLRSKVSDVPASEIAKLSPSLASFMTEPWNAAVAKDDVTPLMQFEQALTPDVNTWANTAALVGNNINNLTGHLLQAMATVTAELDGVESFARGEIANLTGAGPVTEADVAPRWSQAVTKALKDVGVAVAEGEGYEHISEYTFDRMLADPSAENVTGLLFEQGVGSIPAMLGALYALPAYIPAFTHEMAQNRAKNDGGGDVDLGDMAEMLPVATAIGLVDRFSTKGMLGKLVDQVDVNTIGRLATEVGKATVREGGTEAVQEYAQYAAETVETEHGFRPLDAAIRAGQGAFIGMGIGGGIRAGTATYQMTRTRQTRDVTKRTVARFEQQNLDQRLDTLGQARLRQLAPAKFSEYVAEATKGESLYLDPAVLDAEGAADIPELQGAVRDGTDIPMSYEAAVALKDNPESFKVIRPFLKTGTDRMSQSELGQADPVLQSILQQEVKAKRTQRELDTAEDGLVRQMMDTGRMTAQEAAHVASTTGAYIAELQNRLRSRSSPVDLGIKELFDEMGLSVARMPSAGAAGAVAPDIEPDTTPTVEEYVDEDGQTVQVEITPEQQLADVTTRKASLKQLLKCVASQK